MERAARYYYSISIQLWKNISLGVVFLLLLLLLLLFLSLFLFFGVLFLGVLFFEGY